MKRPECAAEMSCAAVQALAPATYARGGIRFARGVRAGSWVFATGQLATDFSGGLAPGIADPGLPRRGRPRHEREAGFILERLAEVLHEGGANLEQVVRLDQYFTTPRAVPHYHAARHRMFAGAIPASTSVLQPRLLFPQAAMEVEAIARADGAGARPEALTPEGMEVPPAMGFSPVVRAGDFVFLAGQMAERGHEGLAPEARVPATHQWKGLGIKLETEYILRHKLGPALAAAGSSLANAVKAQVYLADIDDLPGFNAAWSAWFSDDPPASTVIPVAPRGFNCVDARIEINLVALTGAGTASKRSVAAGVFTVHDNQAQAIHAGDLLFLSGLMAVDANGVVPQAAVDADQPYLVDTAEAEAEHILDNAERLCRAAGTSLDNVVRIQQFHTDLRGFPAAHRAWRRRLGDRPLPFSAIEVPEPLPVPGCSVEMDLWVYAP